MGVLLRGLAQGIRLATVAGCLFVIALVTGAVDLVPGSAIPASKWLIQELRAFLVEHREPLATVARVTVGIAVLVAIVTAAAHRFRFARSRLPAQFADLLSVDRATRTLARRNARGLMGRARGDLEQGRVTLHLGPLQAGLRELRLGKRDQALVQLAAVHDAAKVDEDLVRQRLADLLDQRSTARVLHGVIELQLANAARTETERYRAHLARALDAFDATLAIDPEDLDALELRAETLVTLGRLDDGAAAFENLLHTLEVTSDTMRARYDVDLVFARAKRRLGEMARRRAVMKGDTAALDIARDFYEAAEDRLSGIAVRSAAQKLELARVAIERGWIGRTKVPALPLVATQAVAVAEQELRSHKGLEADALRAGLADLKAAGAA